MAKTVETVTVSPPPEISRNRGPFLYYVVDLGDGSVRLSPDPGGTYGPAMPRSSVKHFVNDMSGRVDLPPRGNKEIDAVVKGRAKILGKGDDGLAFLVGSKVVKVSTTVPYQPMNGPHISPEVAVERLRRQTVMHNRLAQAAPNIVDRAEFVKHGDKGFQIKPFVEIRERLTRDQLDRLQDGLIAIHRAGFSIRDSIQAGIRNGKPIMFDVGKAEALPPNDAALGIYSRVRIDMDSLSDLYRSSGHTFVRRDIDEAQQYWDKAREKASNPTPTRLMLAADYIKKAASIWRARAKATMRGAALDKRLAEVDKEESKALAKIGGKPAK